MKKYIFIIIMLLCSSFTPIHAEDEGHQSSQKVITQEDLINQQLVIHTLSFDEPHHIQNEETYQQSFTILNSTKYDLQLQSIEIIPDEDVPQENLYLGFFHMSQDYPLSEYQDHHSIAFQQLQDIIIQQRIFVDQQYMIPISYHLSSDTLESLSTHQIDIQLQFQPILVKGELSYQQTLQQSESYPLANMKVNLWQNNDLIDTTLTDEKGYYQFCNHLDKETFRLEIECPKTYTSPTACDPDTTLTYENALISSQTFLHSSQTYQFSIRLLKQHYKVRYFVDDQLVYEEQHFPSEMISIYHQSFFKEGYTFLGWSHHKDGDGKNDLPSTQIKMPNHDLSFYASFQKKELPKQKKSPEKQASQLQVQTSDETHLTVFIFLMLVSCGVWIVMKSLKKK